MARNPELEAILQARYDLETCEPGQKAECRARLDALILAALTKAGKKDLSPAPLSRLPLRPTRSSNWPGSVKSVPVCREPADA